MNLLFTLSIAVFAALSSFIPSTGKIFDNRCTGLKKIQRKGWFTIICIIILINLTVLQNWFNERETKNKEKQALIEQNRRDSIQRKNYDYSLTEMKRKFDASNINTVKTVAEALGKYGFKLDSANLNLVKVVRDSAKTNVILPDSPVLVLCNSYGIELEKSTVDRPLYTLSICSQDASSSNFNVVVKLLVADSLDNIIHISTIEGLTKDVVIPKGNAFQQTLHIPNNWRYSSLYVSIKGTYQDFNRTKIYPVDNVYYYKVQSKKFGILIGRNRENINGYLASDQDF